MTETLIKPEVGMGATHIAHSDCRAYTIIAISESGKTIKLQRDKVKLLNGHDSGEKDALVVQPGGFAGHTEGVQRWSYEADPEGSIQKATLRKSGGFSMVGSEDRNNVRIGTRTEHYDYNF